MATVNGIAAITSTSQPSTAGVPPWTAVSFCGHGVSRGTVCCSRPIQRAATLETDSPCRGRGPVMVLQQPQHGGWRLVR